MMPLSLRAEILYDAIVEDGRAHSRKQFIAGIVAALEAAHAEGRNAGAFVKEREIAEAAGMAHGLAHLRGDNLLGAIRQLAAGGKVSITVENEPPRKPLRLVAAADGPPEVRR